MHGPGFNSAKEILINQLTQATTGRENPYMPLYGTDCVPSQKRLDADIEIPKFLQNQTKKICLMLSEEAGIEETLFAKRLSLWLLKGEGSYLPLYVHLSNVEDIHENLIEEAIKLNGFDAFYDILT